MEKDAYSRRDVLKLGGVVGTASLAGCMGDDEDQEDHEIEREEIEEELSTYSEGELLNEYLGRDLAEQEEELDPVSEELYGDNQSILDYLEGELSDEEIEIRDNTIEADEEQIYNAIDELADENSELIEDLERINSIYDNSIRQDTGSEVTGNETTDNSAVSKGLGSIAEEQNDNQTVYNQTQEKEVSGEDISLEPDIDFGRIVDIYSTTRELDRENSERPTELETSFEGNQSYSDLNTTGEINVSSIEEKEGLFNVSDSQENITVSLNESVGQENIEEIISQDAERSGQSYTEALFENLQEDPTQVNQAFTVGEHYNQLEEAENTDEETVLQAYLDNEITSQETQFLAKQLEQDSVIPTDPTKDQWAEDGVGNQTYLEIGINPLKGHQLIAELNEDTYTEITSGSVSFTRESQITGEEYTINIEQETFDDLLENELEMITQEYGKEDVDWRGSGFNNEDLQLSSRDEALRELAHFNIAHKETNPDLTSELTEEIINGSQTLERRSNTWSPRGIELIAGLNQVTDLYLENGLTEESAKFYEEIGVRRINQNGDIDRRDGEQIIEATKEELEDKKDVAREWDDSITEPEDIIQNHKPTRSSSTSSSDGGNGDDDNGGGGPPGDGGGGGGGGGIH